MIALMITLPRPSLTERERTLCTRRARSSRTVMNCPLSMAGTFITTSISSTPSAIAASAAAVFTGCASSPWGSAITAQLFTSAPCSASTMTGMCFGSVQTAAK